MLISLYVDDMIITGNANNLIKEIKQQRSQVFEMKDLRNLHYCLDWRYGKTLDRLFSLKGSMPEACLKGLEWSSVDQQQHHYRRT